MKYISVKDLSKIEYRLYILLCKHLNGGYGDKSREYGRKIMSQRRKSGLTQKAQRKYYQRNSNAIAMYQTLIRDNPSLLRKNERSFGRGVM